MDIDTEMDFTEVSLLSDDQKQLYATIEDEGVRDIFRGFNANKKALDSERAVRRKVESKFNEVASAPKTPVSYTHLTLPTICSV